MALCSRDEIYRRLFFDRRRFSYSAHIPERRQKQVDPAQIIGKDHDLAGDQEDRQKEGVCRPYHTEEKRLLGTRSRLHPKVVLKRQRRRRRLSKKRSKMRRFHKPQKNTTH
jgi:ABC-type sugar transport system ATPase subunit